MKNETSLLMTDFLILVTFFLAVVVLVLAFNRDNGDLAQSSGDDRGVAVLNAHNGGA
jgi:hypothetical protein